MIFFKTGYARVPKVLNITGLLKDWDAKSQSFRVGSAEATTKNKLLFDLRTKYLHVADTWEAEERNWSPVQLSHCFDEVKQTQSGPSLVRFISNRFFSHIFEAFLRCPGPLRSSLLSSRIPTAGRPHWEYAIEDTSIQLPRPSAYV